jgi:L-ascorbate metabolism protein UlaG (beta-lactamase superfamily)
MADYKWLGHASLLLEGSKTIYIDPYELPDRTASQLPKADIICITHSHHDHFSPEDMATVSKLDTIIVATPDCAGIDATTINMSPGGRQEIGDVVIDTVPAYNIDKSFHPQDNNWVGYIITLDGTRYYHSGDTDFIPEMEDIEADVVFLPVGGKYTMDAREAAQAADIISPDVAVPMHWGAIIGSSDDAELFRDTCHVPVKILEPEV